MTPLRIGLTGGIGSGKSTVSAVFEQLGATVIDADAISRSLTLPGGAAIEPIRAAFGAESIDAQGAMDRARMREAVFADPAARRQLEGILHPLIAAETMRQASNARTEAIVFDVPLLAESAARWRPLLDCIFVIDCEVETQVARVMARSGWSREAVQRVIAQQARREERLAIADVVIRNDGVTLSELDSEVRRHYESVLASWRTGASSRRH